MAEAAVSNDEFTAFWNNVLVDKFERFRDILLDGLSYPASRRSGRSTSRPECRWVSAERGA